MIFRALALTIITVIFFSCVIVMYHAELNAAGECTHFVSTSGSDSNNGTSESLAFKTITKGVGVLDPGDVLCVREGTYNESFTVTRSGTASSYITIKNFPGEKPVIDGEYKHPSTKTYVTDPKTGTEWVYTPLVMISANFIKFEGFEVMRSRGRGI